MFYSRLICGLKYKNRKDFCQYLLPTVFDYYKTMEKSKIQYDRKAKIKLQVERITDRIIEAFTIESRRVFYTEDEGLISYEESEVRLIRYGAVLAIALATTASILLSHNSKRWNLEKSFKATV